MSEPSFVVRCRFSIRRPAPGGYRYDLITLNGRYGDTALPTPHPPLPGDLISLYDHVKKTGGTYRVIERAWLHASWGSANWPVIKELPVVGPSLDIIVEEADGPFRDEVPADPG